MPVTVAPKAASVFAAFGAMNSPSQAGRREPPSYQSNDAIKTSEARI
jgi:hypothetical protein